MISSIIDFPECNTSFIEQDDTCQSTSIYPESLDSRLCDGLTSSSSSDSDSCVTNISNMSAWNKAKCFSESVVEYSGKTPDYRKSSKSPIDYFYQFLNKSMIKKIMESTNLYASQREQTLNVSYEEIEQYIGVLLYMGVFTAPDYRLYWNTTTHVPTVADIFSRKRFDAIKSNLLKFYYYI